MYIRGHTLDKENLMKLFVHAIARSCWLYFNRDSFMSLFVQILSCLSRQTDISGNNVTAIGLSLPKVKISRSQSLVRNPTQDGVGLFSSYFFLIFVQLDWPKRSSEFLGTTLVNCIYLTEEKSNVQSKNSMEVPWSPFLSLLPPVN